jgi:hypothetical protein
MKLRKPMSESLSRIYSSWTYAPLALLWRRSLRNGSWVRLSSSKKALYRCALWVAKARGRISNRRLIEQILQIASQLLQSVQSRIASAGSRKARMMLETYEEANGVFSWAPQVRRWLSEASYVRYLGVLVVNS